MLGDALVPAHRAAPGAAGESSSSWTLYLPEGLALRSEGPRRLLESVAARFLAWGQAAPLDDRAAFHLRLSAEPLRPGGGGSALCLPQIRLAGARLSLEGDELSGEADLSRGEASLRVDVEGGDAPALVDYALRVLTALLVEARGGLLLHGAGLVRGGAGLLLLGPSGTGKTTAARNAAGARVLNDDLVLLLPAADGGWQLHASPFSNPSQVPPQGRAQAPLAAILRLRQAPVVRLRSLSRSVALAELLAAVPVLVADADRLPGLTRRLDTVLDQTPAALLDLRADPGYWELVDPWLARRTPPASALGAAS